MSYFAGAGKKKTDRRPVIQALNGMPYLEDFA